MELEGQIQSDLTHLWDIKEHSKEATTGLIEPMVWSTELSLPGEIRGREEIRHEGQGAGYDIHKGKWLF